ncbi:MAG: hypothetical protein V4717_10055 [Bacteroidota bacterium]
MKHWPVVYIPLFLFVLMMPGRSNCQLTNADTALYNHAIENATAYYHSTIKDQHPLLTGRMNLPYPHAFKDGIPYFLTDKFTNGEIFYDGLLYKNIPLLFDQVSNYVITLAQFGRLELVNEKIVSFRIDGHQFKRLQEDSLNKISTGFYEQLYTGPTEVLLKEKKSLREEIQSGVELTYLIDGKRSYFIKKDNSYFIARSKKELLDICKTKQSELQQFIKKNKLNFKKDMANAIVRVAEYYDQLTR